MRDTCTTVLVSSSNNGRLVRFVLYDDVQNLPGIDTVPATERVNDHEQNEQKLISLVVRGGWRATQLQTRSSRHCIRR